MIKFRKMMAFLLPVLLLPAVLMINSLAHSVPDLNRTGSISLSLAYNGNAVTGGTFEIWRVGDISVSDGNYGFVKSAAFAGFSGTLDDVSGSGIAEALFGYVNQNNISSAAAADNASGIVVFSGLKPGLYLVAQTEAFEGFQSISPFLISLPRTENGGYIYDVSANPKIGPLVPVSPSPSPDVPTPSAPVPTPAPTPDNPNLPQTGQLNWPVPVFTVAGMLMFIIGWAMRKSRKNEDGQ